MSGHNVDRKGMCLRASAVRSSKNKWLQKKAQLIQDALAQGRPSVVWQDVCAIHLCRAGIQPVVLFCLDTTITSDE